jgi:hypothetical protein
VKSVLIRPTTGARRATRRTALAAALLLASSTLAVSVPQQADAVTSCLDGGGIDGDPFLVAAEADLRKVGSGVDGCTLGAHYLQTQDITLTAPFTSIGRDPSNLGSQASFTGVYDGGEKSISGMEIVEATRRHVGFVAQTSSSAKLRNIVLVGAKVQGDDFVGGLVGRNDGEIRNVVLRSADIRGADGIGGVVGWHSGGVVSDVHFAGAVIADETFSFAGGLAGFGGADIVNSSAAGSVDGVGSDVGGLVGYHFAGWIRNSQSSADVSGAERVGGLVGWWDSSTGIENSYATGEVSGTDKVGGLIGLQDDGTVTNAFSVGAVTGNTNVGGLIGEQSSGTIEASFWDLTTSGRVASAGGEGKSTAELTSFATFDAAWNSASAVIVAGWQAPSNPTWGICAGVNGGYPFLLWQFDTDPCDGQTVGGTSGSTLTVTCDGQLVVGGTITCTVRGGGAAVDVLWRAAYNPAFAGAGVTLGQDGSGTFSFVVPAAALGETLTVELVEWTQPIVLGVVGGPVPASVPAGEGSVPFGAVLFVLLGAAGVLVAGRRLVTAG